MPKRNVLVAFVLGAILGLAFGGSYVWAFLKPLHAPVYQQASEAQKDHANAQPNHEKEDVDRELAVYTLWLMIFTGILAVATVGLGVATYGLYRGSERQIGASTKAANAAEASAAHIPRVERAYLTGGGPVIGGYPHPIRFRVEVENHGKTPAYLCAFDVHFSTLDEVRQGPQEVFPSRLHDDRIRPGGQHTRHLADIDVPPNADVIYGAFWYQDVLKREHIFRFILRIDTFTRDTHTGVSGVDDSYSYWD